jgi:hypothetical protein
MKNLFHIHGSNDSIRNNGKIINQFCSLSLSDVL